MGYMGFGLQKWIYRQKPRKPFTKSNKPVGDTFEATGYAKDELIISGRKSAHVEEIDERLHERVERIESRRRASIINGSLIIIALLILLGVIIYKSTHYDDIEIPKTEPIKVKTVEETKAEAYQMILDYGNSFIKKKDYEKAIIEFKQAIKLYPYREEARIGLANAYYFLCIDLNLECEEAIRQYSNLLKKNPDSEEYLRKRAEIYTHQKEFEKADSDLNKIEKQ